MSTEPLAFPLTTLAAASDAARSLDVCDRGHLIVAGRSCWKPRAFTADLTAVICDPVEHAEGTE